MNARKYGSTGGLLVLPLMAGVPAGRTIVMAASQTQPAEQPARK